MYRYIYLYIIIYIYIIIKYYIIVLYIKLQTYSYRLILYIASDLNARDARDNYF